ncbi:unnamed protein product [Cuscuta campestris]|uniref:Uncharacterized protein n=1 Tax=Cuscuta campestris TaxID=132261 RepID=A0A484N8N2_9ASTE|nr:unnamed protein product [Cuscuta campestris]
MDSGLSGQQASSEAAARELLIDISNSLPERASNSEPAENSNTVPAADPVINGDGADVLRSMLIAISYDSSPDDGRICNGHG